MNFKILTIMSILSFSTVFGTQVFAGIKEGGGGDLCEDRIKIIRDDFRLWIGMGFNAPLRLPAGWDAKKYSHEMDQKINSTKIRCVGSNDSAYPVKVGYSPKTCRFDVIETANYITCDRDKFQSTSESDQYVLIHHEFAGLAGIEVPDGEDSNYSVSNQISEYLVDQVVKRLAVKASAPTGRIYLTEIVDHDRYSGAKYPTPKIYARSVDVWGLPGDVDQKTQVRNFVVALDTWSVTSAFRLSVTFDFEDERSNLIGMFVNNTSCLNLSYNSVDVRRSGRNGFEIVSKNLEKIPCPAYSNGTSR